MSGTDPIRTGPIHTVLVDAGGVLFNNVNEETSFLRDVAVHHGAPPDPFAARVAGAQGEYESDDRHVHEVLADALRATGAPDTGRFDGAWVDRRYVASVRTHDIVFEHLRRLRGRPRRPALVLANNEARHWDSLKDDRFAHLRLFDATCSSWVVNAVKPAAGYFARVLAACGARAAECLLVDDRAAVVQQAALLGMRTVLLTDPRELPGALDEALHRAEHRDPTPPVPPTSRPPGPTRGSKIPS
ncbi:MAG: HAD family hydrolase [Pseudonocardia sp.]